jgi:hypothetical protein
MIVNDEKIDVKIFLDEFEKRFKNFCSKAPLFLHNPIITEKGVALYHYVGENYQKKKLFDFNFDFTKDVKSNIYDIRQQLIQKYYPTMVQIIKYEQKFTTEELNYMVSSGDIAFEDITPNGGVIETKETKWRIEKVIMKADEIIVRNLETNKTKRFRLKIPCTFFLKKILNEIKDPYDRWKYFDNKSRLISEGYEVDKYNNIIDKGEKGVTF